MAAVTGAQRPRTARNSWGPLGSVHKPRECSDVLSPENHGHVAFGVAGYALSDMAWQLPPLIVAVVIGTYTGKWLLQFLSKARFRLVYRIVLSLIALRLITSLV